MNKINDTACAWSARFFEFLVMAVFVFCTNVAVSAAQAEEEKGLMDYNLAKNPQPLDPGVESSIDYIFDLLGKRDGILDVAKLQPMLNFVVGMQTDPKDIAPKRRFGGQGICLRQDAKADLGTLLRYFYNPTIPNYLLCPAVLRYSSWHKGTGILALDRPLWEELATLDTPVVVRGREYESTSPDTFAEAYYRYDLNRMIILLKHNGKNVAISVSEQADKSDVGRKGAILDDKEWEYFYSGIEGLNKGGISWMDTFMYKSASVQIFVEEDVADLRSSVFLFKWLKAGWASINVVKRRHIYDGSLRYVRSMTKVLESTTLTPDALANGMNGIRAMTDNEINGKIKEYARNFEIRFKDNPKMVKKEYAKVIANGGYANVLDTDARKAILAIQMLKGMMGMETLVDMGNAPVAQAPSKETQNILRPEN